MNKVVRKGHAETIIIAVEMIDGSPIAQRLEEAGGVRRQHTKPLVEVEGCRAHRGAAQKRFRSLNTQSNRD